MRRRGPAVHMTSNSKAAELDHLDELDREYYRLKLEQLRDELDHFKCDREYYELKLEQLSWCLPVVRAAKAWRAERWSILGAQRLDQAVRALEAAEREGRWTIPS